MLESTALYQNIQLDKSAYINTTIDFITEQWGDCPTGRLYVNKDRWTWSFHKDWGDVVCMTHFLSCKSEDDLLYSLLDFAVSEGKVSRDVETMVRTNLFAVDQLFASISKKNVDVVEPDADARALTLFLEMNARNRGFKMMPATLAISETIDRARNILHGWFSRPALTDDDKVVYGVGDGSLWITEEQIREAGRFGPGASVGTRATSYPEKVGDAVLSATAPWIYRWYLESLVTSPCVSAELVRAMRHGLLFVDASKTSCVPKSQKISRVICTEPALNMFFQLGLGAHIEERLRAKTGLHNQLQPERNKRLAQRGSLRGHYGTIDLKSASDTISLRFCRNMLPAGLFAVLLDLRCKRTIVEGKKVHLAMVSSMGNGFTFPLQTAIFTALTIAAYSTCGIKVTYPKFKGEKPMSTRDGNFGVFGDDIVVRREVYNHLCDVLETCGFIVNRDKSFNAGVFRESCGGDYYNGRNVRGIYTKSFNGLHSLHALINKLGWWSSAHFDLTRTYLYVYAQIGLKLPVPPFEDINAGIQMPLRKALALGSARRDASAATRNYQSVGYQLLVNRTKKIPVERLNNPFAGLKALLRGDVEGNMYSVRKDRPCYQRRLGSTSRWNSGDPVGLYDATLDRWFDTIDRLLGKSRV